MAGVGKLASNVGHSKVKESIDQQKKVVDYLRTQIEREPNVEKRQQLKTTLLQEQDRLMRLHSIGNAFYDRMSEEDKSQVIGLNQKLSDLRDRAQASKGKEKDQLISEFESLYGEKSAIESKYITEEELSELNKERPSTNQLLNLIEEVAEERTLSPEEAAQAENSAKEEDDAVSFTNEEVANEVYTLLETADEAKRRGDVRTYVGCASRQEGSPMLQALTAWIGLMCWTSMRRGRGWHSQSQANHGLKALSLYRTLLRWT